MLFWFIVFKQWVKSGIAAAAIIKRLLRENSVSDLMNVVYGQNKVLISAL